MKENNHICFEYEKPKIPTMLYYSYYQFLLSNLSVISVINSKKYPLQNS